MKNITFTADDNLIAQARGLAQLRGTTLNEEFRVWIASYISAQDDALKKVQTRHLIDQLTAPVAGQPAMPIALGNKATQKWPAVRTEFNEREQRILDRLDASQNQSAA
jgi:spore germination cell wall hydrolase CwlJ-like protein